MTKVNKLTMLSWIMGFFSGGGEAKLILRPHKSIVGSPGFPTLADLTLTASAGETVGTVLDRFNTYRGPTHQITEVYAEDAATVLPLSTVLHGTVVAIVKNKSVNIK